MRTSRSLIHGLLAVCALLVISTAAFAADPGLVYPAASEVSDQKAGSILFYNTYTSSASAPAQENTRINITNTSTTGAAFVHLSTSLKARAAVSQTPLSALLRIRRQLYNGGR
jgi:hypothetical protein